MRRRLSGRLFLLVLLSLLGAVGWHAWRQARQAPANRELGHAIQRKDARAVARLLDAGADPNARTSACPEPRPSLFDRLTGLTTGMRERMPVPVLHWAVSVGDRASVQQLIRHGADVNRPDAMSATPLLRAVWAGRPDIAGDLLSAGAEASGPTVMPVHSTTPLVAAIAEVGNPSTSLPGVDPAPPMVPAESERRHLSRVLVQVLLRHGADPREADPYGRLPLHLATTAGRGDIAALLRDAGAR